VSRIVPAAIEAALGGHPLVLRSSGDCRHDFLHVSDAVGAFTSVARRLLDRPDDVVGQAFNAGSGVAHSVFEVADVIGAAAGVALAVKSPVGAVPDTDCVLDSSRLCAAVGWVPTMPLAEGIADAVSAQQQMLVHAGRS
jgi:nucleoside-diphosphate-sugar epimerase